MMTQFLSRLLASAVFIGAVGATQGAHAAQAGEPGALGDTTVVLTHGAFADGSSWSRVIPLLEAKGLHVVAVQNPLSSLSDDVAATKRVIEQQTGPVVLVGHSWAGVVISEAGNDANVKALVYVAAFAPDAGQSIHDLIQGLPPAPWSTELHKDSAGFLRLSDKAIHEYFAPDLSATEQRVVAATQGPWLGLHRRQGLAARMARSSLVFRGQHARPHDRSRSAGAHGEAHWRHRHAREGQPRCARESPSSRGERYHPGSATHPSAGSITAVAVEGERGDSTLAPDARRLGGCSRNRIDIRGLLLHSETHATMTQQMTFSIRSFA